MTDPRIDRYTEAVTQSLCFEMEFDGPKQEAAYRLSCEDLVKQHIKAAQGDTTPAFYVQQIIAHAALRDAMRAHIHHMSGTDEGRDLALYLSHAEHLARRRSR